MYKDNLAYSENQEGGLLPSVERVNDPACRINHIVTKEENYEGDFLHDMDNTVGVAFEDFFEKENGYPLDFVTDEDIRPSILKWERRKEVYSYVKQGDLLEMNVRYYVPTDDKVEFWERKKKNKYGYKRGENSLEMSKSSAWRLKQVLLKTDLRSFTKKQMLFVTLTFPNPVENLALAQNALRVFNQFVKRKYGVGSVWKQEFQKNTAVHYHLFQVFPNSEIELGDYWIRQADGSLVPWERGENGKKGHQKNNSKAVKGYRYQLQEEWTKLLTKYFPEMGEEEKKLFNASIQADYVKNKSAIATYFAEYATKDKAHQNIVPEGIKNHGRWWGETNFKQFRAKIYEGNLSYEEYEELQADVANAIGKEEYNGENRKHYALLDKKTKEVFEKVEKRNHYVIHANSKTSAYMQSRVNRAVEIMDLFKNCNERLKEYKQLMESNYIRDKLEKRLDITTKVKKPMVEVIAMTEMEKRVFEINKGFGESDLYTACKIAIDEEATKKGQK